MPLENVDEIVMSEEDAQQAYEEYAEAVKNRKEEYLEDLKKVYYALSKGKKVIDIFKACKTAGLNENKEPNLAISVANEKIVVFRKEARGSGTFFNRNISAARNVQLPSDTWPDWERERPVTPEDRWNPIKSERLEAVVPIVPAHLLPRGNLKGFYVMWQPKEWKELPQLKDPYLLKRISNNLFIILSEWEVSEIEQAAVHGALVR